MRGAHLRISLRWMKYCCFSAGEGVMQDRSPEGIGNLLETEQKNWS